MISTTLLPPAPRGPGGPHPLVPLAFIAGFLAGVFPALIAPPARAAEIIGYRIALTACRGGQCQDLPVPASFYAGRYACQGHAANLATLADMVGPKALGLPPGPWRFEGMCPPVLGQKEA